MRRLIWGAIASALLLSLTPAGAGALLALGGEFQVNTYTVGDQLRPTVAGRAPGDFIVTWSSVGQDGGFSGIFAQRYDATGLPNGSEFQVNTYTNSGQILSAVSMAPDGRSVVAWLSTQQDGLSDGVFAQRLDASGSRLGTEFQVNVVTSGSETNPAVLVVPSGDFVVAWEAAQDGSNWGIFARRFASNGSALGGEFAVNSYTEDGQFRPALAADAMGNFVVAWDGRGSTDFQGVHVSRFDSAGAPVGSEFLVNSYTASTQYGPSVATAADGGFVVTWSSFGQDGYNLGVFAQRFDAAAARVGTEFQVNAYTGDREYLSAVASAPNGDFVIAWMHRDMGGSPAILAQRYDSQGVRRDAEVRVSSYTVAQYFPSITATADGQFVVVWENFPQDGNLEGSFGQRIAIPAPLDDFECYKAKDLKDPQFPQQTVSLADQFESKFTQVKKPFLACNPASLQGAAIGDPAGHLTCYKIADVQPQTPFAGAQVEATDQFGTVRLEIGKPFLFCAPSAKSVLP